MAALSAHSGLSPAPSPPGVEWLRSERPVPYEEAVAVMERLVALDRSNANWQRDLAIAHERIGTVLLLQDKLDEALVAYRSSLAIIEPLAVANPGNPEWQRALSVSYDRLGDALKAQQKFGEALKAYDDSLAIRQRLALAEPGNATWQHDLFLAQNEIADILELPRGTVKSRIHRARAELAAVLARKIGPEDVR